MVRGLALLAVLVVGCSSTQPAPISYGRASEPRAPSSPEPHDTALARHALRPEEAHPFNPARIPRAHRIGPGESLHDIATRYQVPVLAMIAHNGLEPPYALTPGRTIELPRPRLHTVGRGETIEAIAARYGIDRRSLLLFNRLPTEHQPRPGDRIALPAAAELGATAPAPPPQEAPPPARDARFRMPVDGLIVADFGPQASGERRDGVEIAGRVGEVVRSAADGEVVYAGEDLPAYGALVLIRHADNYVTAYGYNRRLLVRVGDRVRAGAAISELGRTRLLFQVRQGATAVNPAPLLGLE